MYQTELLTEEQLRKIYMKIPKRKLVEMLIENNKQLGLVKTAMQPYIDREASFRANELLSDPIIQEKIRDNLFFLTSSIIT